jgi:hypothetical protein
VQSPVNQSNCADAKSHLIARALNKIEHVLGEGGPAILKPYHLRKNGKTIRLQAEEEKNSRRHRAVNNHLKSCYIADGLHIFQGVQKFTGGNVT